MMEFKNIQCSLGGLEVLKNVSGSVQPGKITAILGPNGCGKTTLLRSLLGLVGHEGQIIWNGGAVSALPLNSLGYLPQAKEIYWPLTCEAVVELGNKEQGTKNKDQIETLLKTLSISYLKNKRIDEISGGERSLVLLARALLNQPEIIVADEPIADLDPSYQLKVMQVLRAEAARGATVLTTMHDIYLTQQFCDDVFLIKNGSVIKSGSVHKVLTAENLRETFDVIFTAKESLHAK